MVVPKFKKRKRVGKSKTLKASFNLHSGNQKNKSKLININQKNMVTCGRPTIIFEIISGNQNRLILVQIYPAEIKTA